MGEAKRRQANEISEADYFGQAYLIMAQGNYAEAERMLRTLWVHGLQHSTPNAAVASLLGQCLMERARAGERGFLPTAAEWLATAYHVNADLMVGLQLGDAYAKMGSTKAAREVFTALAQREDDGRNLPLIASTMLAGLDAADGTGDLIGRMTDLANAETKDSYATVFRGFARMWLGRWEQGWADHAQRFSVQGLKGLWRGLEAKIPYLKHADVPHLAGKTVGLWMEQGHGDLVFLSLWLRTLQTRFPDTRFTLQATAPGHDLLNAVLTARGDAVPWYKPDDAPHDFQCSVLDVPHLLGPAVPPPAAPRTHPSDGTVYIKLQGLAANFNNHDRSCHDPAAREYLFKRLPHALDLDALPLAEGWSWGDTVKRLSTAEALICCDTAVSNIAAVLGIPCFLIPPTLPEYRWGTHPTDVPWAPSVRLIRRTKLDAWLPALHSAANQVQALAQLSGSVSVAA